MNSLSSILIVAYVVQLFIIHDMLFSNMLVILSKYIVKDIISKIVFFLIICAIFIIPIILNFTYFETNDDFGMMLIAEGNISGNPESDLIFPTIFLGTVLKFLYTVFPFTSWYPILQLCVNFTAFYIHLIFVKNKISKYAVFKDKVVLFIICIILPWSMYLQFFYSYQFTITSLIASGIGFTIWIYGTSKQALPSMILIISGVAWRPVAGLSIIILLFIIYTLTEIIFSSQIYRILNVKKMIIFGFFLGLLFLSNYYLSYSKETSTKNFIEFNAVRGTLHGYSPTEKVAVSKKEAREGVNWSQNDYNLFFNSFFYGDKKVFSTTNLSELQEIQRSKNDPQLYFLAGKKLLINVYKDYFNHFIFLFFYSIILFILLVNKNKSRLILFFVSNYFFLFSYLYLSNLQGRLPGRVVYPILIIFMISFTIPLLIKFNSLDKNNFKDKINFDVNLKIVKKYKLLFLFLSSLIVVYFFTEATPLFFLNFFIILLILFIGLFSLKLSKKVVLDFKVIITSCLMLFSFYSLSGSLYNINKSRYEFRNDDPQNYLRVQNYTYNKPIVAFSSFYSPFMDQNQFNSPEKRKFFRNVIHIGTSLYSSSSLNQLNNYALSEFILLELANQRVYLGVSNNLQIQEVTQFILEHYGIKLDWPPIPLVYAENGLQVWRSDGFLVQNNF